MVKQTPNYHTATVTIIQRNSEHSQNSAKHIREFHWTLVLQFM